MPLAYTETLKVWWLTLRPKTLTASFVPVALGTALAFAEKGSVDLLLALAALFFGICIQIATNFFNDVEDWKKKADTPRRLGPQRAIQRGIASAEQVSFAACFFLFLAVLFAIPMFLKAGVIVLYLTLISMLLSYAYTGGPYPLAYCGLGEIFVLIFFGLIATATPYFLQTGTISTISLVGGLQLGLLATVLIAINNLRDKEEDSLSGKNTLAVLFSNQFALGEITFCIAAPFFLLPLWYVEKYFLAAFLPLFLIPLAYSLIKDIIVTLPGQKYNAFLSRAALLHLLFGMMLIASLVMRYTFVG